MHSALLGVQFYQRTTYFRKFVRAGLHVEIQVGWRADIVFDIHREDVAILLENNSPCCKTGEKSGKFLKCSYQK